MSETVSWLSSRQDGLATTDTLLANYTARRWLSFAYRLRGIGVILGTIAIYAVVSNSLVRRRRELAIGLRLGIAALISWACISYRRASVPDQTDAPAEMEMLRGLRN